MNLLKNKQEKGFLLIDALVAMLILTIALVAIVGTISSASKLSTVNEDVTRANKLAQFSMEKLKQVKPSTWKEFITNSDTQYKTIGPQISTIHLTPINPPNDPNYFKKFTCVNSAKLISTSYTGTHLVEVRSEVKWTSTTPTGTAQKNTVVLLGYCERQED